MQPLPCFGVKPPEAQGPVPHRQRGMTGESELDAGVAVYPVRQRASPPKPDHLLRQRRRARTQLFQARYAPVYVTLLGAQFLDNPHPTSPLRQTEGSLHPPTRLRQGPRLVVKLVFEGVPNGDGEHWVTGLYRVCA